MAENRPYLLSRYQTMSHYIGTILNLSGLLMLMPLIVALFYPTEWMYVPAVGSVPLFLLSLGVIFRFILGNRKPTALSFAESGVVVLITWLLIPLLSALPYILISRFSASQAVFDSVSGWTTTGLSLLDVSDAPKMLLFFRSWTQLLGGAGMAIIMIASITGANAAHLYSAEGKGNLIKPNVRASARIVINLYLIYLLTGIVAYLIGGMNLFDAITHCFAAISTGGFSNYADSIGHYNSIPVELITILLMILGNLNFVTGYLLLKRNFIGVWRNGEIRLFSVLSVLAVVCLFFFTTASIYANAGRAIRVALFEGMSALTTTGFTISDYQSPLWNDLGVFVLVLLMLVGGGTSSTAGGIKQYRIYLVFVSLFWQIRKMLLPRNAVVRNFVWEGEQKKYIKADEQVVHTNFVILYLSVFVIGAGVIMVSRNPLSGEYYSLRSALFEFASSLGTVGLSIGVTSPNNSPLVIWAQTIGMLLGRLEFLIVITALAKLFSDIHKSLNLHRNRTHSART